MLIPVSKWISQSFRGTGWYTLTSKTTNQQPIIQWNNQSTNQSINQWIVR